MSLSVFRVAAAGVIGGAVAWCHYTWVAPVAPLEVGKTVTVRISHGHKFPAGEEAINASQLELFVLTPSGAKVMLEPAVGGGAVNAAFQAKETGTHRIVLAQDRGVTSRTPKGVKPGGRDKNPDATQSYRTFRTAVSYAGTGPAPAPMGGKPVGLELELTGERTVAGWRLQLLKHGKPMSGVRVEVFLAGAAKAADVGQTGPDGAAIYQPPAGAKGPALFSAQFKDAAPAGAPYDSVNYETSLLVTW